MKLEILGTGGAASDLPTAYLIDDHILVDCGLEIVKMLYKEKRLDKVDTLCITHFHMDHVSGLEFLIYFNRFAGKQLTIYAGPDFLDFYKVLACSKGYGNEGYVQDFVFMELKKNDNNGYLIETHLLMNHTFVLHMGGAVPSFAYTFTDYKEGVTVIISGDTDKPLDLISVKMLELQNAYLFHDMGMTGYGVREQMPHPTEEQVFEAFGYSDRIIGIHTDFDLTIFKKAEKGIFEFKGSNDGYY